MLVPAVQAATATGAAAGTAATGKPSEAAGVAPAAVGQRFAQRFDGVQPDGVRSVGYGLYEVQVDDSLFYTDADVSYLMQGYLVDAATRRNLTQERMEQLSAIDFDQLPLELAIKQVHGDGSRKLAIFEDPNCRYCKQLRQTLAGIDNVTVYAFLLPILSQDSHEKSQAVWCAKDPAAAWDAWMVKGIAPQAGNCDAPLDQLLALGKRLNVRGTPAIFFEDGTRAPGALPADELRARLDRAQQAAR
ncbi:DsbC family protein [Kerstersia similis]|uniref:DsbC family protein n=1 Tax=Kerstersia similis TaxID=206505 RepID=UPI0039EF4607